MPYIPHTAREQKEMLAAAGAASLEDLFSHLPKEFICGELDLPKGLGEMELQAEMARRANKNKSARDLVCFLGAGAYDHFIPPAVDQLILRGELYSAYTPYQPEISQGVLQIIYEYQTMIANLCGCDMANASLYDGATAMVEGCQMAMRHTGRNAVLLDGALHPNYIETVQSMLKVQGAEVIVVPPAGTQSDLAALEAKLGDSIAAVVSGYPNFFGAVQDISALIKAAHAKEIVSVVVSNPISFGLLEPAGGLGADIVCGEAQTLGVPLQYGGPYLGYLACKTGFERRMPGRLVGQTLDTKGRRAFTLTLQAREQHIRREKATSNICTNEALCAMMAHFYLCCLGANGLRRAAEMCAVKTVALRDALRKIPGVSVPDYAVFNEFVIETKRPAAEVLSALLAKGILGGLDLGRYDSARKNQILVAVTEKRTTAEIAAYAEAIRAAL